MYGESGMFFGGFMWIFWLLVIAAVVSVIISTVNKKVQPEGDKADSPLDILKRRYARGEIDEEEFCKRRKGLEN